MTALSPPAARQRTPLWLTAAALGGIAAPVLLTSLVAYVALWIGDVVHGVFAALGTPQVVILTTVVAIAAALFALSSHPAAKA